MRLQYHPHKQEPFPRARNNLGKTIPIFEDKLHNSLFCFDYFVRLWMVDVRVHGPAILENKSTMCVCACAALLPMLIECARKFPTENERKAKKRIYFVPVYFAWLLPEPEPFDYTQQSTQSNESLNNNRIQCTLVHGNFHSNAQCSWRYGAGCWHIVRSATSFLLNRCCFFASSLARSFARSFDWAPCLGVCHSAFRHFNPIRRPYTLLARIYSTVMQRSTSFAECIIFFFSCSTK